MLNSVEYLKSPPDTTPDKFRRAVEAYEGGDLKSSELICENILSKDPRHLGSLHMLGAIYYQQDEMAKALHFTQRAFEVEPANPAILSGLGLILVKMGQPAQALANYDKVLEIWPDHDETLNNRGIALMELCRPGEALASYDRAIALRPDYANAHYNRGNALSEIGWFEEEAKALEAAIDLAPKTARFYRALLEGRTATHGDPHVQVLDQMLVDAGSLGPDEQIELHFALGKAYADLGEHDRSFRHLLEGNTLKRKRLAYDEAATQRITRETSATFTTELIGARTDRGGSPAAPIFIVGMPRSGSTLVEQILASHSRVFGAGEVDALGRAVVSVTGSEEAPASPGRLARLSHEALDRIGSNYIDALRSLAPGAERITDKTLSNFRFIGLIHRMFPNARIIHTCRQPMDTCFSCFSTLFAGKAQPFSYDLTELGRYYRAYEAMMDHWRAVLPANVMLDLRYEDVVADLEGQVRRVLAHCGVAWESACLDFHKTERQVRTASREQVRRPLYQSSVGRWRNYEAQLEPLLAALGAPPG